MVRKKKENQAKVEDYRHEDAKRKNIPPAGLAARGRTPKVAEQKYFYNPHLPPVLRFDDSGKADRYPELLEIARQRPLTGDEVQLLAEAIRNHEPWLEWAGKREKKYFEVDPVALHIHERISAQAIIKVAAREDVQRNLFADPQLDYHEAVKFYQHDVDWSNRLILGDSLVVMNSLAKREDLAGKVQMIYIDPPYGIKFSSNFQPEVGKRDVKDREKDLTREPEMVKAYRDTWTLGVHSYLSYLRDRLFAAKELLTDSGSIFVQIGEENLHRVRMIMDEVFGDSNFCAVVPFAKTSAFTSELLSSAFDFLLWYAKDKSHVKYRTIWQTKRERTEGGTYDWIEMGTGEQRRLRAVEVRGEVESPKGLRFRADTIVSPGATVTGAAPITFNGKQYSPSPNSHWKTTVGGMERLLQSGRVLTVGKILAYKRYIEDFPLMPYTNVWSDTIIGTFSEKFYVVQTSTTVIERCLLMTTDPGDLVLDPTCGSGTTAYVAEKWGRRWITIDTSRVSIAIARQRLLTAKFDYFKLKDQTKGVCAGFVNKTVPHITLKSIAQNVALDPIFEKHEPILAEKLEALNAALEAVTPEIRKKLKRKLLEKERNEGKKAITDADRRRWDLPNNKWEEWEVPFDTDPDWPETLQDALADYRKAWRSKVDEVNECIAASAEKEELVDQPEVERGILRVSGPFTVEAVQPPEERLDETSPIDEPEGDLETFEVQGEPIISATMGSASPITRR